MLKRFNTDLMSDFSVSVKYSIRENCIKLFNAWVVDLRDFAFFLSNYIENAPKMNIKTYDFVYNG